MRSDLIAYVILCGLLLVFAVLGISAVSMNVPQFLAGFLFAAILAMMVLGFVNIYLHPRDIGAEKDGEG